MTIKIEGKCNISAEIAADSRSSVDETRITTFVLEYPRFIHSEFMTHRLFSRNSASSRAIPFSAMEQQLTGMPVRFGAANKGMQDKGVDHTQFVEIAEYDTCLDDYYMFAHTAETAWGLAKENALRYAEAFYNAGYHKQVYNRLTEPFQMMRVVCTATEWNNFFALRNHSDADPTIAELARVMLEAYNESFETDNIETLKPWEWHTPFVDHYRTPNWNVIYALSKTDEHGDNVFDVELTLEEALKVSASCCAGVSYRKNDYSMTKALEVYDKLIGGSPKHWSPFEHQGTPITFYHNANNTFSWEEGITHMDRNFNLWSGNFKSWIQYRQLLGGWNVG